MNCALCAEEVPGLEIQRSNFASLLDSGRLDPSQPTYGAAAFGACLEGGTNVFGFQITLYENVNSACPGGGACDSRHRPPCCKGACFVL